MAFLLSTVLNEAIDEGLIGANPCRKLRINVGDHHVERLALTADQVARLLAHTPVPAALLVAAAAYTGPRWGELAGLQWHNVDLDDATITVDRDKVPCTKWPVDLSWVHPRPVRVSARSTYGTRTRHG